MTNPVRKDSMTYMAMADAGTMVDEGPFGPWMLVERKNSWQSRESRKLGKNIPREDFSGSRFKVLTQLEREDSDIVLEEERSMGSKNKGKEILGNSSK